MLVRAQELARTTLARSQDGRVQHDAYTLQFRPLMFFIASTESDVNCIHCLEDMARFMDEVCLRPGYAPFAKRVRQLHKDHALSLETARETSLPNARPVDDFAHFDRNGQKEIPKRCEIWELDGKPVVKKRSTRRQSFRSTTKPAR